MEAAALGVPAGLVGAAAIRAMQIYSATATGDPRLEPLRWPVAVATVGVFGVKASPAIARARIVLPAQENSFGGAVGDKSASVGPSVTPWQLSRALAMQLGLWTPAASGLSAQGERDAYVADAASWTIWRQARNAARAFKSKLAAANGDVADAIRRWNGSGPAAEKYALEASDKATSFCGGLG